MDSFGLIGAQGGGMTPDTPDLLRAIDALVAADEKPSGLSGRIVLCVRTDRRDVIWTARLDGRAVGHFTTAVPGETEAILVLGANEAERLLDGHPLPSAPSVVVGGDRRLLERFFTRYCSFSNWLDVRLGGATRNKKK